LAVSFDKGVIEIKGRSKSFDDIGVLIIALNEKLKLKENLQIVSTSAHVETNKPREDNFHFTGKI
ncbi:MAG: hypothetical protein H0V66_10160, partial [Bdellovibrionales bacterium]|nr:hypothetical protein [Bdellovibrionales bacterium]